MSTPIKREDIRKGDKYRRIFAEEFTADTDLTAEDLEFTYELIERPVVLPTKPGVYMGSLLDIPMWLTDESKWYTVKTRVYNPGRHAPFTLLRPVAEVAAEVLKAVRSECSLDLDHTLFYYTNRVAAKYGVTL